MLDIKSEKELAFVQDLFIATDWGERFAELIDKHVKLPKTGSALYLNAGTGGHAMALQERAGHELKFLLLDESKERLELARAKAATTRAPAGFRPSKPESLDLEDAQFDLVIADGSLVAPERVVPMIAELVRVARPGASVAFSLPTSSSFGEFFSIYWEALHNCGFIDHEIDVEILINEQPTVSQVEEVGRCEGLVDIMSWTQIEEFDYQSGEAFSNSPLVSYFLMKDWLKSVPEEARARVIQEVERLIDEERHNADFSLTVKATLVMGRKVDLPLAG
ncbi:MAG TPA: class I SAM-dependent methyltransferase [Pyrinomonadaceae bacterium]|nr:class I SAM-dependent methyltransferase [Pyrinomonadaceae bacterium]